MLGIGRWGPLGRMEVEAGGGAAVVPGVAGVADREPGPAGSENLGRVARLARATRPAPSGTHGWSWWVSKAWVPCPSRG